MVLIRNGKLRLLRKIKQSCLVSCPVPYQTGVTAEKLHQIGSYESNLFPQSSSMRLLHFECTKLIMLTTDGRDAASQPPDMETASRPRISTGQTDLQLPAHSRSQRGGRFHHNGSRSTSGLGGPATRSPIISARFSRGGRTMKWYSAFYQLGSAITCRKRRNHRGCCRMPHIHDGGSPPGKREEGVIAVMEPVIRHLIMSGYVQPSGG